MLVTGLSLGTSAGNLLMWFRLLARVCEMLLGRDDVLLFALAVFALPVSALPVSFAC